METHNANTTTVEVWWIKQPPKFCQIGENFAHPTVFVVGLHRDLLRHLARLETIEITFKYFGLDTDVPANTFTYGRPTVRLQPGTSPSWEVTIPDICFNDSIPPSTRVYMVVRPIISFSPPYPSSTSLTLVDHRLESENRKSYPTRIMLLFY